MTAGSRTPPRPRIPLRSLQFSNHLLAELSSRTLTLIVTPVRKLPAFAACAADLALLQGLLDLHGARAALAFGRVLAGRAAREGLRQSRWTSSIQDVPRRTDPRGSSAAKLKFRLEQHASKYCERRAG